MHSLRLVDTTTQEPVRERAGEPRPDGIAQRGVLAIGETERLDPLASWLQGKLTALWGSPAGRRTKDALNGTWLGHPLHPALTDIPLGAWTVAAACDVVTATGKRDLDGAANAALAVGIAGAVGSALTGLADWSDTRGGTRRVGLAHAGLNSAALVLQIASLAGRRRGTRGAKLLSALGYTSAAVAAYLGGDLVYRRGTQVDRNAWREGPRDFVGAIPERDLPPEQPTQVEVDGARVMLVRHEGEIFALADVCGHEGCPLSKGRLEGSAIVCPCHGSTYRLRDGAVLHGPSPFPQPSFDVRIDGGLVALRRRRA